MSDEWFHRFQYPNGTLKNKFDIQNHDQLQKLEYEESAQNALALLQIRPDIKDISSLEISIKYYLVKFIPGLVNIVNMICIKEQQPFWSLISLKWLLMQLTNL